MQRRDGQNTTKDQRHSPELPPGRVGRYRIGTRSCDVDEFEHRPVKCHDIDRESSASQLQLPAYRIPPACETGIEPDSRRHREYRVQPAGAEGDDRGDSLIVQPEQASDSR